MRRIIVTGGAGFIGSEMVSLLLEQEDVLFDQLVILDKLTYASDLKRIAKSLNDPRVDFFQIDLANHAALSELLLDDDLIFHFAAESHVDNSINSGHVFWESNVLGTTNILELMKEKKRIKLIYVSTDEVYGSITEGSFDELSRINPSSPYSASKASGELACLAYKKTHGLNVIITRACNNFGAAQNKEKFIPVVVTKLINNEIIPVYGNGSNIREWISARLHCNYLFRIMFSENGHSIYNLGSGIEISNLDLIGKISTILNIEPNFEFVEDRKAHDYRYSINSNRFKSEYGIDHLNFDDIFTDEIKKSVVYLSK